MVAQVCHWFPMMTTLPISYSCCSYPNSFTNPAFDSEQVTNSALISKTKTIYATLRNGMRLKHYLLSALGLDLLEGAVNSIAFESSFSRKN